VNVYVMPFRLGGFPGAVQRDGAATRGSGCPSPSGALRVVHEHAAVAARTAGVAVGIGAPAGPKVRSAWRALRWLSVRTPERRSDAFCSSLGDWRMEEVSPPPRSTSWRCSRMGSGIQAGRRASSGRLRRCAFSRSCIRGVRLSTSGGYEACSSDSTDGGLHGHSNRGRRLPGPCRSPGSFRAGLRGRVQRPGRARGAGGGTGPMLPGPQPRGVRELRGPRDQ